MKTCYDVNETMRLLGYQYIYELFTNKTIRKEIDDIAKARPYSCTIDTAMDVFVLGYIYGKRAERARRKRVKPRI